MPKIHFRSYIHNQMQRIDKDIVKCPQIVSADNLSNTKKEERITLHLLMEFAREELSLIKYKTKRRKIIKVHLSLCFVIKYTFSTPWKRKIPCKSAIYKGFVVPRPGVEPGWIAPLVFETSASTDSAIWACVCGCKYTASFGFDQRIERLFLVVADFVFRHYIWKLPEWDSPFLFYQ